MSAEDLHSHHHKKHAGREDLTGEHRMGDTIQLILMIIFLAVWILDSFVLGFSTFLVDRLPGYVRLLVGIPVLIFATYLVRSGLKAVFGKPPRRFCSSTGSASAAWELNLGHPRT